MQWRSVSSVGGGLRKEEVLDGKPERGNGGGPGDPDLRADVGILSCHPETRSAWRDPCSCPGLWTQEPLPRKGMWLLNQPPLPSLVSSLLV